MIFGSPFIGIAPELTAQTAHTVKICNDLVTGVHRPVMIFFRHADDRLYHIRKAAAAPTALLERMINLRRHDELPRVGVEQRYDRRLDFLLRNDVAVTNKHSDTRLAGRVSTLGCADAIRERDLPLSLRPGSRPELSWCRAGGRRPCTLNKSIPASLVNQNLIIFIKLEFF
jgi:hypothetical protein